MLDISGEGVFVIQPGSRIDEASKIFGETYEIMLNISEGCSIEDATANINTRYKSNQIKAIFLNYLLPSFIEEGFCSREGDTLHCKYKDIRSGVDLSATSLKDFADIAADCASRIAGQMGDNESLDQVFLTQLHFNFSSLDEAINCLAMLKRSYKQFMSTSNEKSDDDGEVRLSIATVAKIHNRGGEK